MTLLVTGAIVLLTIVAIVLIGLTAGRRHEHALPEWWIPLFAKASLTGTVVAVVLLEYGQWKTRDAYLEQIVRQGTVIREDRQTDRTVYDFDPALSGGWGRLNRYDFRIIWELMAGVGAVGATIAGLLALIVARISIRMNSTRPAFPVRTLGDEDDHGIGKSA